MKERSYIAIDLKSFYASVECAERGLDPLTTNLVVADLSRTEKTICLAVSPSLKAYGIGGRARLFEVISQLKAINSKRLMNSPDHRFTGKSCSAIEIAADPSIEIDYIAAKPQMAHYIKISTDIYRIYLKYISPEDIHVYSIDEVFIDATNYLKTYGITAHELARLMISDVLKETKITATAGIGTNMFLAKVAMDIVAKHIPADKDGVRIAELDEMSYREKLWEHTPITDFWRVGKGYAVRLENMGIFTMGDVACRSVEDEESLYREFGVNAELLIDHAWGWEPCTIADIKAYKPENSSIGAGQVLHHPYDFEKARLVVKEMMDDLALTLVSKHMVTDMIRLDIGYERSDSYKGATKEDRYGRLVPKPAHGQERLGFFTASSRVITKAADDIFCSIADKRLKIRRINVTALRVINENDIPTEDVDEQENDGSPVQISLFDEPKKKKEKTFSEEDIWLEREKNVQLALVDIKNKYGKNSVIKAMDLEDGATTIQRNGLIGGHRS